MKSTWSLVSRSGRKSFGNGAVPQKGIGLKFPNRDVDRPLSTVAMVSGRGSLEEAGAKFSPNFNWTAVMERQWSSIQS